VEGHESASIPDYEGCEDLKVYRKGGFKFQIVDGTREEIAEALKSKQQEEWAEQPTDVKATTNLDRLEEAATELSYIIHPRIMQMNFVLLQGKLIQGEVFEITLPETDLSALDIGFEGHVEDTFDSSEYICSTKYVYKNKRQWHEANKRHYWIWHLWRTVRDMLSDQLSQFTGAAIAINFDRIKYHEDGSITLYCRNIVA